MWRLLLVALATTMSLASALNQQCSNNEDCDSTLEYCDKFESKCRSCRDLCNGGDKFAVCEDKCENYLKEAIFSKRTQGAEQEVTKDDIRTVQILLVVVTSLTLVILVLLVALVCLKVKGRKRREKEVIPMSDLPAYNHHRPRSSTPNSNQTGYLDRQIPSPPLPSQSTVLPNGLGRSLQTMTTQISHDTDSSTLSRRNHHNGGGRGSFQSNNGNGGRNNHTYRSPSRIPSEDRVPDTSSVSGHRLSGIGYDNAAMDSLGHMGGGAQSPTTPTASQATSFPPINDARRNGGGGGGPFTISHTQVV